MATVAQTTTTSFFSAAFEAVAAQVRAARTRRAQRVALVTLMDMDAGRLDDLGLSVQDVTEALAAKTPATAELETRRARRATTWNAAATA